MVNLPHCPLRLKVNRYAMRMLQQTSPRSQLSRLLPLRACAMLLAGLLPCSLHAYELTSPHLADPERLVPPMQQMAEFWHGRVDPMFGGYFTNVEQDGTPVDTDKVTLQQSRAVYGAVRAFQLTGEEKYLDDAEQALRFLYKHAWDSENGGWFSHLDREGKVQGSPDQDRSAFHEHYALLGIVTMLEATDSARHREWLDKARAANDRLWDQREGIGGYYHDMSRDWSEGHGKSFTAEADAITSHLLFDYLINRDPGRAERLRAVADHLRTHLVGRMDHPDVASLFPYAYDSDWGINHTVTCLDIGHLLKTAWHMTRLYLVFGNEEDRKTADFIMERFRSHGKGTDQALWHEEAGIPRGRLFWGNGTVYQDSGVWWTLEQAVLGGFLAWKINGNERDLETADRTMAFFMKHYWDEENGDAHLHVAPDGKVLNSRKGFGFHTSELLYCAYLYSNLYYHQKPVTLHYRFEFRDEERSIRLTPLAIPDEELVIESVEWQDAPFESFDPVTRTIQLAPGQGGVFRVTYQPVPKDGVVSAEISP